MDPDSTVAPRRSVVRSEAVAAISRSDFVAAGAVRPRKIRARVLAAVSMTCEEVEPAPIRPTKPVSRGALLGKKNAANLMRARVSD